ncbi:MAG: prepilin-type N-terminal cleavage/methylation domain-containing protein [Proteobacteria bacterium]|nr:prepilin-type N-terminal cleavage/methylation domain-containing protein [Pseudomonadota bacterium]MBU4287031.1 prepilin-type N-terminal cleavage/methylation domain-containing protein [Pseudomonadota bacterium]MBU4413666.1 prepilin-type N-terminal cleavage/methylation domain-containing protein [Pseudomonadota bacterium]MCG2757563.1 prepilin-type N-terminal cleavage/methylation domain-containing protein [Desulfobacteraceae bacterium]
MSQNNKGFTLIEVLVAMVILTVGLLGTAALITGIIKGNKVSNRITTATVLAQDKIEEIKGAGYAGADAKAGTEDIITNFPLYKRITGVANDDPAAGMKKITVTVYWDSDNSQVELQTILAN